MWNAVVRAHRPTTAVKNPPAHAVKTVISWPAYASIVPTELNRKHMPHLKIEYSGNLDAHSDIQMLCTALARTLTQFDDGAGMPLFPLSGTRVLAYPAPHYAVADGAPDKTFMYLNLRIAPGRSAAVLDAVGKALLNQLDAHFARLPSHVPLRVTLHFDEGRPVYEGKWASANP